MSCIRKLHAVKTQGSKIPLRFNFFPLVCVLLLASLSVESTPLPIRAQIAPLTSLLALLFLPFILTRIQKTPLMQAIVIFVIFAVCHSLIALFIDVVILGQEIVRIYSWARQVAALSGGVAVFFVLRVAFPHTSHRVLLKGVFMGAIPAIALSLVNIVWGLTGNGVAETIVMSVRPLLGHTSPSRVSGFSLEPASFAFYLAVVVFPISIAMLQLSKRRILLLIFLLLGGLTFAWTLSATGFAILLSMLIIGAIFGPKRRLFLWLLIGALTALAVIFFSSPHVYVVRQLHSLLSGNPSLSVTTRLYSTFGPISSVLDSYTLLGYGLGGTATHLSEIMPAVAQADIALVTWQDMPNLKTLTGRLLAETGIFGISLAGLALGIAFWEMHLLLKVHYNEFERLLLESGNLAFVGLIVGHSTAHGSFALPYLWFWLAIIDSRYILRVKRRSAKKAAGTT